MNCFAEAILMCTHEMHFSSKICSGAKIKINKKKNKKNYSELSS